MILYCVALVLTIIKLCINIVFARCDIAGISATLSCVGVIVVIFVDANAVGFIIDTVVLRSVAVILGLLYFLLLKDLLL
jgi:hypothetical protein